MLDVRVPTYWSLLFSNWKVRALHFVFTTTSQLVVFIFGDPREWTKPPTGPQTNGPQTISWTSRLSIPYHPWDWYIYLHLPSKITHSGKNMLYILPGLQSQPFPTRKKSVRILPELCKFQSKIPGQTRGEKNGGNSGVFVSLVMASQFCSHFHPDPWGRFPFLTNIFQLGWFNHQLVTWKKHLRKIAVTIRLRWAFVS